MKSMEISDDSIAQEIIRVDNELSQQFIYPLNPTLKKAYQAVIRRVLEDRRIVFQPATLTKAILDHMGWIDDSNLTNPDKPEGANYKKAKNILKTFERKFTKLTQNGLEVFVFRASDRSRVGTYAELEELCAYDRDMSEVIATTEKLNLDQKWHDRYVTPTGMHFIDDRLAEIDNEIKSKKTAILEEQAQLNANRHQGKFKLSSSELSELIEEQTTGDL